MRSSPCSLHVGEYVVHACFREPSVAERLKAYCIRSSVHIAEIESTQCTQSVEILGQWIIGLDGRIVFDNRLGVIGTCLTTKRRSGAILSQEKARMSVPWIRRSRRCIPVCHQYLGMHYEWSVRDDTKEASMVFDLLRIANDLFSVFKYIGDHVSCFDHLVIQSFDVWKPTEVVKCVLRDAAANTARSSLTKDCFCSKELFLRSSSLWNTWNPNFSQASGVGENSCIHPRLAAESASTARKNKPRNRSIAIAEKWSGNGKSDSNLETLSVLFYT